MMHWLLMKLSYVANSEEPVTVHRPNKINEWIDLFITSDPTEPASSRHSPWRPRQRLPSCCSCLYQGKKHTFIHLLNTHAHVSAPIYSRRVCLSRQAQPSQVYFSGEAKGESAMKTESDMGNAITHQFRVSTEKLEWLVLSLKTHFYWFSLKM